MERQSVGKIQNLAAQKCCTLYIWGVPSIILIWFHITTENKLIGHLQSREIDTLERYFSSAYVHPLIQSWTPLSKGTEKTPISRIMKVQFPFKSQEIVIPEKLGIVKDTAHQISSRALTEPGAHES